jgi:hypothetical protein
MARLLSSNRTSKAFAEATVGYGWGRRDQMMDRRAFLGHPRPRDPCGAARPPGPNGGQGLSDRHPRSWVTSDLVDRNGRSGSDSTGGVGVLPLHRFEGLVVGAAVAHELARHVLDGGENAAGDGIPLDLGTPRMETISSPNLVAPPPWVPRGIPVQRRGHGSRIRQDSQRDSSDSAPSCRSGTRTL